jgi:hypothetical protein
LGGMPAASLCSRHTYQATLAAMKHIQ